MKTFEIIEKSAAERSNVGADPLNPEYQKAHTDLNSIGLKWEDGKYTYGIWGEYADGWRNAAWFTLIQLFWEFEYILPLEPFNERVGVGGPRFVLGKDK